MAAEAAVAAVAAMAVVAPISKGCVCSCCDHAVKIRCM